MFRFLKYLVITMVVGIIVKIAFDIPTNLFLYFIIMSPFLAMTSALTESRYYRRQHYHNRDWTDDWLLRHDPSRNRYKQEPKRRFAKDDHKNT